jgi:glycosyltransferase involved in cell wall biosynthesis
MLSILIPVYNFNIVDLVREIHSQSVGTGIQFEIIVLDDGSVHSSREENRIISNLPGVKYEELPGNTGRSKIRNRMAGMAQFPWLLFLDCDAEIPGPSYISSYLDCCIGERVVCGGRIYADGKPADPQVYLRWKYGIIREQKSAAWRNIRPWDSFMTNNFLIPKSVFNKVQFDEEINRYGHEDTFFGIQLKRKEIPVLHTDNPLIHTGLETGIEFLEKTQAGIENLCYLMHTKREYKKELVSGIKILRHYDILKKAGLVIFIRLLFRATRKFLRMNILGRHPTLKLFDLYKLGYLIEKDTTLVHQPNSGTQM